MAESKPATQGRTKGNVSQLGLNAGVITKLRSGHTIDISVSGTWPSASSEPAGSLPTTYDQTIYTVKGRMFIRINPNLDIVPLFNLFTSSGEAKIGDGSAVISTDLVSFKIITGGLGINYRYDDFLITGGPGLRFTIINIPAVAGLEPKLTNTYFSFPVWNLGVEWYAAGWLIARLGYTAETVKTTLESSAGPDSKNENIGTEYIPGEVRAGIGIRTGRFSIYATINSDV
ncbi:MAG: hypothetical protein WC900_09355, partial [Oscillospiraceae bacterium]